MKKIDIFGRKCWICGEEKQRKLQRHHIGFVNKDSEKVILICERCHKEIHKIGFIDSEGLEWVRLKVKEKYSEKFEKERGYQLSLFE